MLRECHTIRDRNSLDYRYFDLDSESRIGKNKKKKRDLDLWKIGTIEIRSESAIRPRSPTLDIIQLITSHFGRMRCRARTPPYPTFV